MAKSFLRWSKVPYGGENDPPTNPVSPEAGLWPTYYIKRVGNKFFGLNGVIEKPKNPNKIDWNKELQIVEKTLNNITKKQIKIAKYWGYGPPTKQWTPIIDRLIDTYNLSPTQASRVLAAVHAGINDTLVAVWYYKYHWDVARPIQYDSTLESILCTPRFPTYVSGHAAISGCTQVILSYFFPTEEKKIMKLAEENAKSRLYAGVHFPIDNNEGLKLGRQVGAAVVSVLKTQLEEDEVSEGLIANNNLDADLIPPPYKQVIPFDFDIKCTSNTKEQNLDKSMQKYNK